MSSLPGLIDPAAPSTPAVAAPARAAILPAILPAVLAIGVGALLLYGAAFASTPKLHNAAHDSRHSAGFPCH